MVKEELYVLTFWPGRADGPAVDPGRFHTDKELAVKSGVSGEHGCEEGVVAFHSRKVAVVVAEVWPFSDIVIYRLFGGLLVAALELARNFLKLRGLSISMSP